MLNISFQACTEVKLWELTVSIAVNGEKLQSYTMIMTLIRQCPVSNVSKLFLYRCTTMYSNVPRLNTFRDTQTDTSEQLD